jgi:hypothetical protein
MIANSAGIFQRFTVFSGLQADAAQQNRLLRRPGGTTLSLLCLILPHAKDAGRDFRRTHYD